MGLFKIGNRKNIIRNNEYNEALKSLVYGTQTNFIELYYLPISNICKIGKTFIFQ